MSENRRLRQGAGGHPGGDRPRSVLMLPTLPRWRSRPLVALRAQDWNGNYAPHLRAQKSRAMNRISEECRLKGEGGGIIAQLCRKRACSEFAVGMA